MPRTMQHRQQLQHLWTSPDTFATSLLLLTIDNYSTEALSWDPATLIIEIEEDFDVDLPQLTFDKLMVAARLLTSDNFYQSLPDFISWCNVLNGSRLNPELWDMADAYEVSWGITEAALIEPPDEDEPFSKEILAYIGSVLDDEGIMNPPDILRLALRDTDPITRVQTEFSDDPELFGAIYKFEDEKRAAIETYTRTCLQLLSDQLTQLPLRSGDTADIIQRLVRSLR